jgi:hypothetical protein
MATLPYGTYANPTTPLWATAGAGQQFVSPSEVTNDLVPATAEITTVVNADVTGSFQLNTIPNGTPLNEIKLEGLTNGIGLYTNGQPTLTSAPGNTAVLGDLQVVSQQTGGTWTFNNNELSYNNIKQLTGDATYTQLGENTYSDQYGLNVWNVNSSNKTSTVSDREIYFTTTTAGTTTTNTYDFISPLVPNRTTTNPLVRNPNSRTPLFPNDAYFSPQNGSSSVSVSPSKPYAVSVTNTNPAVFNVGVFLSKSSTPNDWISATQLPLWFELELFDPGSQVYRLRNNAGGFGQTDLLDEIKNVAGVLSFIPLGASTPTTYVVGDEITIVYEWVDIPTGQAQVIIAKNNVVISTAPVGITLASFLVINFTSLTQVPSGSTFTLPSFNWGNTSPIISSFNGWEWSAGLGGLYPRNNTALAPASSGSNPPAILYDSVFLLGGCSMTSPPISSGQGLTITIAGFKGSKLGTGTLQIFQNTFSQIFSGVITNAWTSGTIVTAVSTGSDTFTFVYTSSTDVLSFQRLQISYVTPVDVLDGGVGMNGTTLNLGAGNYYSAPTMRMTSSNVVLTKPLNMSNFNISNVGSIQTNTLTYVGGGGQVNVTANLDMYNNSIANLFEVSSSNVRTLNLRSVAPATTINVRNTLDMLANNISNAGTITCDNIGNNNDLTSTYVRTLYLSGINSSTGLLIGFSNTAEVSIDKVNVIQGRSTSNGMQMKLCEFINGGPACATGSVWYVGNFFGNKQLACPMPPARVPTVGTSITYFVSPDDYVYTVGYTLPPYSTIDIFDSGIIIHTQNNTTNRPQTYVNGDFILDNPARSYRLTAYLDLV